MSKGLLPKGNFLVSKTGSHPMRTKLKLFLKWGITFEEPYEIEEKSARKVVYVDKQEIEKRLFADICVVWMRNRKVRNKALHPEVEACCSPR